MGAKKYEVSEVDIEVLLQSPLDIKMDIIKKIGKFYTSGKFDDEQKEAAERILKSLIKESDSEVKAEISKSIKGADKASNEIVMQLAEDINIVSIPVLEFSKALTDENLIYIIKKTDDEEKEKSICRRETVSENVSEAIIDKGHEEVVATLLSNDGADVSEKGYEKIIKEFDEVEGILSKVKKRAKLPVSIAKAIKETVLDEDEEVSVEDQDVDKEYYQFCKMITIRAIQQNIVPIYALCLGKIKMFEMDIASRLRLPVEAVEKIVDDGGDSFKELYTKCCLPENMFDATETLLCVLNNLGEELVQTGIKLSQRDSKRIITNLMMYSDEEGGIENIEYIITLIRSAAEKE